MGASTTVSNQYFITPLVICQPPFSLQVTGREVSWGVRILIENEH